MFYIRMYRFGRRLLETVLGELAISVFFAFIVDCLAKSSLHSLLLSVYANVIFLIWQFLRLKNYRLTVGRMRNYDNTNIAIIALLCITAVICGGLVDSSIGKPYFSTANKIYTYIFFIFKGFYYFGKYKNNYFCYTASALIISAIEVAFVILLPLFINKKKCLAKKRQKNSRKHIFD